MYYQYFYRRGGVFRGYHSVRYKVYRMLMTAKQQLGMIKRALYWAPINAKQNCLSTKLCASPIQSSMQPLLVIQAAIKICQTQNNSKTMQRYDSQVMLLFATFLCSLVTVRLYSIVTVDLRYLQEAWLCNTTQEAGRRTGEYEA